MVYEPDGDLTVVWQSSGQDGNGTGIYATRLLPNGNHSGSENRLNSFVAGNQLLPSVACDADENFTAVWTDNSEVMFRRYQPSGSIDDQEQRANTVTVGVQETTFTRHVAVDPAGHLLIVWTGPDPGQGGRNIYAEKFFIGSSVPSVDEFRVNVRRTGDQSTSAVAMNSTGAFTVVWQGPGTDGLDVFGQRYAANGLRVGGEFVVNAALTIGNQLYPSVAMNAEGKIVVVWEGNGGVGAGSNIFGRLYAADGTTVLRDFQANTGNGGNDAQIRPSVAMRDDGSFVVVWESQNQDGSGFGIYAQRFDGSGLPVNVEFRVTEIPDNDQQSARVAMNGAGKFVVVWRWFNNVNAGANGYEVVARRFDFDLPALVPALGGEFIPNADLTLLGHQGPGVVGMDASGGFVIAWAGPGDSSGDGIFFRRYDMNGTALSSQGPDGLSSELGTRANTTFIDAQHSAQVAMFQNGEFVVAWQSEGQDGSSAGVYGQRFGAQGSRIGQEFRINQTIAGFQLFGTEGQRIASDGVGSYIFTWDSENQDGSGSGVYASKLIINEAATITTTGAINVGATKATLRAMIDPNGQTATVAFEYDDDVNFNSPGVVQVPGSFSGLNPQDASVEVKQGLIKGVKYYFRAKATVGTQVILGNVLNFTTANAAPVVNEEAAFFASGSITIPVGNLASDPDGDALTVTLNPDGGEPQFGTATASNTAITYAPFLNRLDTAKEGDSFSYNVSDGDTPTPGTATGTVRVYSFNVFKGDYLGRITSPGGGVNGTGTLDLKVTGTGLVTYVLIWQGQEYRGKAQVERNGALRLIISKLPAREGSLTLVLRLRPDPLAQVIAGTLEDSSTVPATVAMANLIGTGAINEVAADDLPRDGVFTATIENPNAGSGALREGEFGASESVVPEGCGYTVMTVGKSKKRPARFAGKMPDAQPYLSGVKALRAALQAAAGQPNLSYRFFNDRLYGRDLDGRPRGIVDGELNFDRDSDRFVDPNLNWERGGGIDRRFTAGFQTGANGLQAALTAIRYGRPRPGQPPSGFDGSSDFRFNAVLTFMDGDLVEFSRRAKLNSARSTVEPSPQRITIKVNARGGTFRGTFIHPNDGDNTTRPSPAVTKFDGVFQRKRVGDQEVGSGMGVFLGANPNTVETSGCVSIVPQTSNGL